MQHHIIVNTIQQTTGVGYYVALTAQTYLTLVSLMPSCSRLHVSLPINLPSWDTPWRTADDILSIVDAPGRGVRAVSLSNKMAFSASSSSLPQPGQIFIVGSISWVINADGVRELLEQVQIRSVPTPCTYNCRSDFGSTSEVASINDSPLASPLPEEAH